MACELRRLVLLLAGLHSEKCPQILADQIRRVHGVLDVRVGPSIESEHRELRVRCEYGIAQVLFDPDVITSAKILARIESYWADVILESPLTVSGEMALDKRKQAIFA